MFESFIFTSSNLTALTKFVSLKPHVLLESNFIGNVPLGHSGILPWAQPWSVGQLALHAKDGSSKATVGGFNAAGCLMGNWETMSFDISVG